MRDWNGSVAFITGGGQGIGLGIARALGKRGVRLALADIDEKALRASKEELSEVTDVEVWRLDVRDREAFAPVADEVEAKLGPVDLLFNNAGIAPALSVSSLDYAKWDLVLGVNLSGVINGVQTFLPRMIARGEGGYVVNTASGAGLVTAGSNVLYTTSKFAVVGLSESLRLAAAEYGIDVSVLCPAYVDTDILKHTESVDAGLTVTLSDDERTKTEAAFKAGVSIDAVGEKVIAGMETKAMWIHTDDWLRPYLTMRMEQLLNSVP
ncbi:SDR family oxidoreductase [Goodfellowiella coeruleoviolacea]|uniref:NADP-dependent 3-hydroxy acid dehydrogenase YdfG n=1 Tax=Goodfellowiella coeruleoviolacea TaxID=334858 RepID=A0AAE3KNI3_9PSEU|nr:SDR family NAD(P)-dependent oxidoreductase [Goodfellowiella coeruleoviolacea]MCP2168683.1 NADP-dependent 3-hydroxy acid dehydrogenase YdfG [Goodfellowiella coeruleoviolacea]